MPRTPAHLPYLLLAFVTALLPPPAAHAATSPEALCVAARNKGLGKYYDCLHKASAKFATGGDRPALDLAVAACGAKLDAGWSAADAKAKAAGTRCPGGPGHVALYQDTAAAHWDAVNLALIGGPQQACWGQAPPEFFSAYLTAPSPSATARKCAAVKGKVAGKLHGCLYKASASHAVTPDLSRLANAEAACVAQFETSWGKAEAKAAASGGTCMDFGGTGPVWGMTIASAWTAGRGALDGGSLPRCPDVFASSTAITSLVNWLALPAGTRPALASQPFAAVALSAADAAQAGSLLWGDYAAQVAATRAGEMGATEVTAKSITVGGVTMRYLVAVRGTKPANGWNLFISMHGGGATSAAENDAQWTNQLALVNGYNPQNAIWVAPRAPTDEWNMWFREHIDALLERIVTDFIVFEDVDPNHVYLNGYSAGGDGAYQMGTRMADSWAGVGMSAGHPNDASPLNLRNTAFAIHVGALDTAFDRNLLAAQWGQQLDALAAADPGGYPHQWQVHAGLPHWMSLQDAVSIPFLQGYTRDPAPSRVVWRQASNLRSRLYWLKNASPVAGAQITANRTGNTIAITDVTNVPAITVRVSDAMLDPDLPVQITYGGHVLYNHFVPRSLAAIEATPNERGDPAMIYPGEVDIPLD